MAARLTAYIVVAIVAVTLIAGLIVGAQREDYSGPVDLIIYNGVVYTADEEAGVAEAVAIQGNRILRVGSNRDIKRLTRRQTTVLDAHGGAVVPGFNDAHVHFLSGSLGPDAGGPLDAGRADRADRLRALRSGIREAHAVGITSVHDVGATPEVLDLLDEIRDTGELTLRVYGVIPVEGDLTAAAAEHLEAIRQHYPDDPLLKVGAVSLQLAGPDVPPGELARAVTRLDRRGWQILIHAPGDAAVRAALDAFEAAARDRPEPQDGRRHRIEHIETIDPADLPRFAELSVLATLQPFRGSLVNRTTGGGEGLEAVRAPGRLYDALREAGTRLVFGSDWPAVRLDPRLGLASVVNGPVPRELTGKDRPQEPGLPLPAAIDAYTREAAYASFDEHRKGQLAPGMLADVVILSTDVFSLPAERLLDATVEVTIFDGRVVYRRTEPNLTE